MTKLVPCLAAVAMLATTPAHANLLTNGSFESGNFNGWITSNLGSTSVVSGPFGAYSGAQSGQYYVVGGSVGATPASFAQTFTDTPSALLMITGWTAESGVRPEQFSITFDGAARITAIDNNTGGHFVGFVLIEQATGIDTLDVQFLGTAGSAAFDNFSVSYYHPNVPESQSLALLAAGLAGFGLLRRPRKGGPAKRSCLESDCCAST